MIWQFSLLAKAVLAAVATSVLRPEIDVHVRELMTDLRDRQEALRSFDVLFQTIRAEQQPKLPSFAARIDNARLKADSGLDFERDQCILSVIVPPLEENPQWQKRSRSLRRN